MKYPFLQFMRDFKALSLISNVIYEAMTAYFCPLYREFPEYNQKTENQMTENQKTENQKTEIKRPKIKRPKIKRPKIKRPKIKRPKIN